jgi:hypothetical protein
MNRRRKAHEMDAEQYQATVAEHEWQSTVVDYAELRGWLVIHVRNMLGNDPGIPDLLMFRGDHYVAAELKTPIGTVSAKQREWHARFAAAGGQVYVWRPVDWDEVQEVLR